jgi:hypothetical protein
MGIHASYARRSVTIAAGACLLLVGTAFGVGFTSWTEHPVFGQLVIALLFHAPLATTKGR